MDMEIPALSSFSSGVNLDTLPASEIETRLRDFFSGRIANPKPDDLIQSVEQLEQQYGHYKEFQFAKAAALVQACDFAGARAQSFSTSSSSCRPTRGYCIALRSRISTWDQLTKRRTSIFPRSLRPRKAKICGASSPASCA
ncbi:hypothetical protein [Bradyrhizobium sp. JR3.5]